MKKNLKVKGMHCKSCETIIGDSLLDNPGVKTAKVSHTDGRVEVNYDEKKVDEAEIRSIIKQEGYEVI